MSEKARADQLQMILDQTRERTDPAMIKVKSAGTMKFIPAENVTYCKGAVDYVELLLVDGKSILHRSSLAELERNLPTTFLRVHRSYIVNTAFVQSLEREESGTGRLHLTNGETVPVSRRIMPSVRKALL